MRIPQVLPQAPLKTMTLAESAVVVVVVVVAAVVVAAVAAMAVTPALPLANGLTAALRSSSRRRITFARAGALQG